MGCGCGGSSGASKPPRALTSSEKAAAAIQALRELGCTCPLVYSAPLQQAIVYGIPRTRYSTCPYHRRRPDQ
jgi:hypothetical protein